MAKIKQILGGLSASFLSRITSVASEVTKIAESTGTFQVDLLNEKITPKSLEPDFKEYIKFYRNWFITQLDKLNIQLSEVEFVRLNVEYKPGKNFGKYYTCIVTVRYLGKDYSSKSSSATFSNINGKVTK